MWRRAVAECTIRQPWRLMANRGATSSGNSAASAINSVLLHSLKDYFSKMTPPSKVTPPSPFTIIKGALDSNGPVLKRTYGKEGISVSVMRLANIIGADGRDDRINQLFIHVEVSKPGQNESLLILCGLYPDAVRIHSVSMRPKVETSGYLVVPTKYNGPVFQDLDENMRDALHSYIEKRGINESLFPFLQAWLYVKDHRNLL